MADNIQAPLATILLAFEDEAAATAAADNIRVEPDETRNRTTDDDGNNVEKTSFNPGDPYYFLVYHTSAVYITSYRACAGSLSYRGLVSRTREDVVVFTELNSADDSPNRPSISYIPAGGMSADWFTSYSSQFKIGTGITRAADLSLKITGGQVPCQATLSYPVSFRSFDFLPPGDLTLSSTDESDSVDIYVVIYFAST